MSATDARGENRTAREPPFGFWWRSYAMLVKEFIQLRRDRVSFAMIVMLPVMQLVLFGFAINTTPRHLPTAVLLQEDSDLGRSILKAMENTAYFRFTHEVHSVAEFDDLLQSGKVLFGVEIPRGFERAVRRGDHPALLVAADATDPTAAGSALGTLNAIVQTALKHDLQAGDPPSTPFEIRAHARYNPAASSRLNIVPGLVGTILTMTMLIFTALSVTREIERGTMESLLSMPIKPVEVMFGKIIPYVIVGFVQATLIIGIGVLLFGVPILGSLLDSGAADDAVHHHQSRDRLHLLDHRAEPVAGDAAVDDVLPAEHSLVRLHVSVRGHAQMGAIHRRVPAADAFRPHRPRHHAQGCDHPEFAVRYDCSHCTDAFGDDDRRDALPSHARLMQYCICRCGPP